jgi:DeoR/GlpR family transcriptional regulator of sugar metabolism
MMMLKPLERREQILKDIDLLDDNMIPILSRKYGVSEMTIRRDLQALEQTGVIRRTYGGAVRWPQPGGAPTVVAREKRQMLAQAQKAAIARYAAAELVRDGDILVLEGSTTVTGMVPHIAERQNLTVMTNSLFTAEELRRRMPHSATLLCAGGILRPESSTFVGPVAERFFRELHVSRLFISATGLTLHGGITDPQMLETQVKRAMIESAGEVIVMLDGTKFGKRSLTRVIDFSEIALLITDEDAPAEMLEALRAQGVALAVVPVQLQNNA